MCWKIIVKNHSMSIYSISITRVGKCSVFIIYMVFNTGFLHPCYEQRHAPFSHILCHHPLLHLFSEHLCIFYLNYLGFYSLFLCISDVETMTSLFEHFSINDVTVPLNVENTRFWYMGCDTDFANCQALFSIYCTGWKWYIFYKYCQY